jgi:radical SAM superfamily enzyme YgiQ (UPF0313 family)
MCNIRNKYGDVNFRFGDDIFGAKYRWMDAFVKDVGQLGFTYRAFVRLNQCASNHIRAMGFTDMLVESGCKHIAVGMESGSDMILSAMQKDITAEIIRKGITNAKASGLIVRVYLIVGFPGETWETINETISLIDETRPDEFVVYPLIPYPGTPLYQSPEKYGLLNIDKDFSHYFQICGEKKSWFTYDLVNADRHELQAMKDYMVEELENMQLSWAKDSKGYI